MGLADLYLADFVPRVSPHLKAPTHAPKLLYLLDRSPRAGGRWLCAFPIRHHKTVTIQHAIALWLLRDPTLRIIYMTHSALYAASRGREIRELCERVGVSLKRGHNTIHDFRTDEGGGVYVMSSIQSALGQDVDILIVDDPFEGPREADDPEIRQRVDQTIAFYTSRLSRGGTVGIVMSRFHPDDAIGRRLRRSAET